MFTLELVMPRNLIAFLLHTFAAISSVAQEFDLEECYETAITQVAMNACSRMELTIAETELEAVFEKISEIYSDDQIVLEKLKISQDAWEALREANMDLRFPREYRGDYGSVFPLCWVSVSAAQVRERVEFLRLWVGGFEEGDACAGTAHAKNHIDQHRSDM